MLFNPGHILAGDEIKENLTPKEMSGEASYKQML